MLTNISISANNLIGNVNLNGGLNQMNQADTQSGYWTLDGRHLTYINRDMFKITQFRYRCYKPNVGRNIHIITNASTVCGQRFVDIAIGLKGRNTRCNENAFTRLQDDTSLILSNPSSIISFNSRIIDSMYYWGPVYEPNKYHFMFGGNNRYECDDSFSSEKVGYWQIYIR